MWHERLRTVGLALISLGMLAGCGRDALERTTCVDAGDCLSGQRCVEDRCVEPEVDLPVADMPVDIDPDAPDSPPDMPPIMCSDVSQCPGQGGQTTEGDRCVTYTCDQASGLCVIAGDVSGIMCANYEVQQGCECGSLMCDKAADCPDSFGCLRGQCAPCIDSNSCDGQVCGEDGRCRGCKGDEDCRADQVCGSTGACEPRPECVIDSQCGPQEICLGGHCTFSPECQADADCREGYECVGDRCFEKLCRGPEDCAEGQLCDAGTCVDQPQDVLSCFVATRDATVIPGQVVPLEAFALDMQGRGVAASFSWTTSSAPIMAINGTNAVAGNRAGSATVRAALANGQPIQCTGQAVFTNIGAQMPNTGTRVLVIHAETGAPVAGAEVVIRRAQGMPQSATTGPSGIATLPTINGDYEVSVFADDFNYLTVQGVRAADLRLPLNPRSGTGPVAGFTGAFDLSRITSAGDFNLGLAGASLAGGLINLDLPKLLGDPFVQRLPIPIPGGGGTPDIPLPGGLVVYGRVFGLNIQLKRNYYAQSAGGARLGWGLAGKVPSSELIQLFQGGNFNGIGDVLALILPLFSRFDHGLQPLNLVERPRVVDVNDFDKDGDTRERLPDYASFPTVDLQPSVRQQLVTSIDVSNFPQFAGGPGEVAILVGGTALQAPGFVPMGISATSDDDGDGRPDTRLLTMAPPYGSAVGGRFALLAIAFRTDNLGSTQGGLSLPDELSFALWNGQSLPNSIQLGTFPSASQGIVNPMTRQVSISAKAGPLFRARFVGPDRTWDVWSPGPAGVMGQFSHTITVPPVPNGRDDLFPSSKLLLDAIRSQVPINDLVRASGVLLTDVTLVSTGFNRTKLRD
jgi:hypothetical protein